MALNFQRLTIPDLVLIEGRKFADERGYFKELFKQSEFQELGDYQFVQDNFSMSQRGVVRGLHYQLPPFAQGKLIQVLKGRVYDVAVDLRQSSPTFGQWAGVELSADNDRIFFIPPGFAHGFVALEDETLFLYKCTAPYDKASEAGVLWNDPALGIDWPAVGAPIVSEKDAILPLLKDAKLFS